MSFLITQGYGTDGVTSGNLVSSSGLGSPGYVALQLLYIDQDTIDNESIIDLGFTLEILALSGQAGDPQYWTITGPTSVTVTSVTKISNTEIRLTTTEPKNGATYTLTLPNSGLTGTSGEPYSGPGTVNFVAIADAPVAVLAQALDSRRVRIIFSEPVIAAEALDATNYSINPALTVVDVAQESARNFVLSTSPQTPGVTYTITVVNVRDTSENPV